MAGRLRNVVQILAGAEDLFILWYIQTGCKAHPASCSWVMRTLSPVVKWHSHET